MLKKFLKLSLLLIVCSVFLSACTLPWKKKAAPSNQNQTPLNGQTATNTSPLVLTKQLKKFANNNELKSFLQEHTTNISSSDLMTLASGSPFADYRADSRASSAPDIIKANIDYTYFLVRNELLIIKNNPAGEAKIISKISFKSRPQGILVNGDSLAVYGIDNDIASQPLFKKFRRQNIYTYLKVYDLSNPADPQLKRDLDFEGKYNNARLVGDYVYFLTDVPGTYFNGEPLLPRVLDKAEIVNPICETNSSPCFAPEVYYFDISYNSFNFVNVTAINIKDNQEAINGQVYLLDNSQEVYVSPNNIYITYTDRLDEYSLEQLARRELVFTKLSVDDQNKIVKIEAAPDYMLNDNEKKLKTGMVIDNYLNSLSADEQTAILLSIDDSLKQKISAKVKETGQTSIYRFSMGSKISYEAIGAVPGQIIDQYSMDENDGFFRIATTLEPNSLVDSNQGSDFYSNLYVLDKELKPVGSLENLATTASIKDARFIGNRVYFSTAKIDDPLYIISLADPAKPTVLGAIKVPNNYGNLLPYDSNGNKLISFGREIGTSSDVTGAVINKGLKLSLFDFTDLQKPKELDNYIIGDESSNSVALNDPLTFNYFNSGGKNFLIIPVTLKELGNLSFAGVFVFDFIDNRLVLKGKIDHSYGGHFTASDSINGFDYYDNTVKRSLFFGDPEGLIYTFSNKLLKINKFSDLSSVKDLILTTGGDDYIITQPAARVDNLVGPGVSLDMSSSGPAILSQESSSTAPLPLPLPLP